MPKNNGYTMIPNQLFEDEEMTIQKAFILSIIFSFNKQYQRFNLSTEKAIKIISVSQKTFLKEIYDLKAKKYIKINIINTNRREILITDKTAKIFDISAYNKKPKGFMNKFKKSQEKPTDTNVSWFDNYLKENT